MTTNGLHKNNTFQYVLEPHNVYIHICTHKYIHTWMNACMHKHTDIHITLHNRKTYTCRKALWRGSLLGFVRAGLMPEDDRLQICPIQPRIAWGQGTKLTLTFSRKSIQRTPEDTITSSRADICLHQKVTYNVEPKVHLGYLFQSPKLQTCDLSRRMFCRMCYYMPLVRPYIMSSMYLTSCSTHTHIACNPGACAAADSGSVPY